MMKKLLVLFVLVSFVVLVGCGNNTDVDAGANITTVPGVTENSGSTTVPGQDDTPAATNPSFDDIDWETDIDVDDNYVEETVPAEGSNEGGNDQPSDPTEPEATDPVSTDPDNSGSDATEPEATTPEATEPQTSEPEPTVPSNPGSSGAIELPMIPG